MMNHVALPASEIKGFKGEMRCQEQFKTIAVAEKNARKKKIFSTLTVKKGWYL